MAQQQLPSEVEQLYSGSNMSSVGDLSQEEVAKFEQLLMQLLQDPQVLRVLAQAAQGQQGGPMGGGSMQQNPTFGQPQPGRVVDPTGGMLMGTLPGPGPVQWLGGMPPGYNDKVAQQLAKSAIFGNVWGGSGLGQGLAKGISQGMGGGMLGGLAGTITQLLPLILGGAMKP